MSSLSILKLSEKLNIILEAKKNIDKSHFNSLRTLQEREKWLTDNGFDLLGNGSSRNVFLVNQRKVIKLAANVKGLAQNREEFEILVKNQGSEFFPRAFDKAPDDSWIEVELVRPFSTLEEACKALNISVKAYRYVIDAMHDNAMSIGEALKSQYDWILESHQRKVDIYNNSEYSIRTGNKRTIDNYTSVDKEFKSICEALSNDKFIRLLEEMQNNQLPITEFEVPSNLGMSGDGRVVISDAGFTQDVADNFYDSKKKVTHDVDMVLNKKPMQYGNKPEIVLHPFNIVQDIKNPIKNMGPTPEYIKPEMEYISKDPKNKFISALANKFEIIVLGKKNIDKSIFNNLRSYKERDAWLRNNGFDFLGLGSSRAVYLVNQRKVLKLAVNMKGIAQNIEEFNILSSNSKSEYFPKVFDKGPDDSWLEVELVRPYANFEDFGKDVGISIEAYQYGLNILNGSSLMAEPTLMKKLTPFIMFYTKRVEQYNNLNKLRDKNKQTPEKIIEVEMSANKDVVLMQELLRNKKLLGLFDAMKLNSIPLSEYSIDPNNLGKTADGRIVIADAGFTFDIARNFYGNVDDGAATLDRATKDVDFNNATPEEIESWKLFNYGKKPNIYLPNGTIKEFPTFTSKDPKNKLDPNIIYKKPVKPDDVIMADESDIVIDDEPLFV